MDDKCIFNCDACGNEAEAVKDCPPECCGKPMVEKSAEPLPVCQVAADPEHARLDEDFGEPCDDGRSGKI